MSGETLLAQVMTARDNLEARNRNGGLGADTHAALRTAITVLDRTALELSRQQAEARATSGAGEIERLREALTACVGVLERLPYGDWLGGMGGGKVAAANHLIRRARLALNEQGEG